jgi:hypothetical protein
MHAYLGELDVRPLESPVPNRSTDKNVIEFRVKKSGDRWAVEGHTAVAASDTGRHGDGASFEHEVTLDWTGYITTKDGRITDLVLSARGTERVKWESKGFGDSNDVSRLPAGRPYNFTSPVRFGIIGAPVPESESADEDEAATLPDKVRKLEEGVRRWQAEGRDPAPIGEIMREFEPLMKAGKQREAEEVMDRALQRLEGKADPLEEKLGEFNALIRRLLREGKREEAEKHLERALEPSKKGS